MADKAWKRHERDVAKLFSELTGADVRRNSCRENADNRERNSDVDVEHPTFQVFDFAGVLIYKGLTIECKYSSGSFKSLYGWLKAMDGRQSLLVVNDMYLLFWLDQTAHVWEVLRSSNDIRFAYNMIKFWNVHHKDVRTNFKGIGGMSEQTRRYGASKGLFPMLALRMKGARQIGVVDMADWNTLLSKVPC